MPELGSKVQTQILRCAQDDRTLGGVRMEVNSGLRGNRENGKFATLNCKGSRKSPSAAAAASSGCQRVKGSGEVDADTQADFGGSGGPWRLRPAAAAPGA